MEPAAAYKIVTRRGRRRFFRYSLRTLVIFSLLCGSVGTVWYYREAWVAAAPLPHLNGIPKIVFSPDGSRFTATVYTEENKERTCRIWLCDGRNGSVIKRLSSHKNSGQEPTFTRSGQWILTETHWTSSSKHPGPQMFDAQSGREFLDGSAHPGAFKFCADESRIFFE